MSRTKNKEHSEVELLRGRVRRLQSENRRLRKRNKQLERRVDFDDEVFDDVAETKEVDKTLCAECGKGRLKVVDLKYLLIESCDICDYRKKEKPKR